MKKLLYLIAILVLGWLAKLSYDVVLMKNQLLETQNTLRKSEQTTAHLNDQLVSLQRKSIPVNSSQTHPKIQDQPIVTEVLRLNPIVLIKQRLELVGFAVQQQQYIYAIEQLNETDQVVEQTELAETLKLALHQAIAQDKTTIQQYVASRAIQEEQLSEALQSIERYLKTEIHSSEIKLDQDSEQSWLSQWFKLDRVDQNTPSLVNRKLILKEIQLRMILAQQALIRGELLEYHSMLDLMIVELERLPDSFSLKLKQSMMKLKQSKMNPVPKLSSLAILES